MPDPCPYRLHSAPHQLGQARRCLKPNGHDGLCQFWKHPITAPMRVMLENPPQPASPGSRSATFQALRNRGLLTVSHKKKDGTYYASKVSVTRRGQALLDGEDVR